jgi:O-antigen ligase
MQKISSFFSISPQARIYYGGILLSTLAVVIFALPSELFINFGLLFLAGVVLFLFLFNLEWGMYAVTATCFFYGWEVFLSQYSWTKNISYLSSLNAPVVDFLASLLVVGVGVSIVLGFVPLWWKRVQFLKIPILLYAFFLCVGLLSALQAYDHQIKQSIKYLIRPMGFVCIGFVLVPALLLQTKKDIFKVLQIWSVIGVLIALFGLSSLVFNHQTSWIRIEPYAIFGFAPLGYNHNMVGEALVVIIPCTMYLLHKAYQEKKYSLFRWLVIAECLMLSTALLTLSRAAWIALALQMLITFYFYKEQCLAFLHKKLAIIKTLLALFISGVLVYMGVFLFSSTVSRSDETRLQMTEITSFYFKRSPWLGYGPGMYTRILGDTFDFVSEHGEPLESHGFIQKILLEEGVIGLVMFVVFLLYIIYFLYKNITHPQQQVLGVALLIMVVGEVTYQLFDASYFSSLLWLPLGVALVATHVVKKESLVYE